MTILGLSGCNSSGESVTTDVTTKLEREISAPIVEAKPTDWYIRLIAEDPLRSMKTGSAQLGELSVSDVAQHTLKALSPLGGSYLEVVFVDPDDVPLGDYASNFHTYKEDEEDVWRFTVRTDDTSADILLTWSGLYLLEPYIDNEGRTRYKEEISLDNPLLKQMKMIDSSNGQEIPAIIEDNVQTYVFNMNGQNERTFRWVLESEEVNVPEYQPAMAILQSKALKKDASFVSEERAKKKVEAFDLNKPPMLKGM